MSSLRLGSVAPDFTADSTKGLINFHQWIGDSWAILFSHPADYTPVCTTELGTVAKLTPEFESRNVKVIGLSVDSVEDHEGWIRDINEVNNTDLSFPLIADKDRKIATLYGMLDQISHDPTNVSSQGVPMTVRNVFIIDPKKAIRLIITYPASCGRNFDEVLRVIDSLQLTDKRKVTTPANWKKGDRVIVHPAVSNEQAKELFGEFETVKPYLRLTQLK